MNLSPELFKTFQKSVAALKAAQKPVAIIGHVRPDGDCVGAQVALCHYLRARGVDAVCVDTHAVPRNLGWILADTPFFTGESWVPQGHTAVYVDCSARERVGKRLAELFSEVFLVIDHHRSNGGFAAHDIVDCDKSATCEILAELLFAENAVDAETARALYVGIATDTGQFQYRSVTARTFELAKMLVEKGADPAETSRQLYECDRPERLRLLSRFLGSLKTECDGRACVGFLRLADFADARADREDAENFVNYPRSLDGVRIAAVLEETNDRMIKGSLRGRYPDYRVDLLAQAFGGGGHMAAAGFTVKRAELDAFYPEFLEVVKKHLETYCK